MEIKSNADLKVLEVQFRAYLKTEKLDRKKLEKMIKNIAAVKADLQVDRINFLLDVRNVLTPEQIKKVDEIKSQFRHKRFRRFRDNRGRSRTRFK